jgi:hypothetical protein
MPRTPRPERVGEAMRARHYIVTNYWYEFFADQHCTLCGNSGVIDTRGVRTAAGVDVGRRNWCICPNGQVLRKYNHGAQPASRSGEQK